MKIRNRTENTYYIENLKSAIDEITQAIDNITYISHPEINQRTISKLRKAAIMVNEAVDICIFKP